jgi:hypothetical protein
MRVMCGASVWWRREGGERVEGVKEESRGSSGERKETKKQKQRERQHERKDRETTPRPSRERRRRRNVNRAERRHRTNLLLLATYSKPMIAFEMNHIFIFAS